MSGYKIDLAWSGGFVIMDKWGDVVARAATDDAARRIRDELNSGVLTEAQINEGSGCR